MQSSTSVVLTILGMAVVTYATRAGGYWLTSRFTFSPRVETALSFIPGSVLVSIVAPVVLSSGPAEAAAALATVVVAARSNNLLLAMVTGVAVVWVLRFTAGLS